jgi:hypothetical protein
MNPRPLLLAGLAAAALVGAAVGLVEAGPPPVRSASQAVGGALPPWLVRYDRGRDRAINPVDALFLGEEQRGAREFALAAFGAVKIEAGPDATALAPILAEARSQNAAIYLAGPPQNETLAKAEVRLAALAGKVGAVERLDVAQDLLPRDADGSRPAPDDLKRLFRKARRDFRGARLMLNEAPFERGSPDFQGGFARLYDLALRLEAEGVDFDAVGVRLTLDDETVMRMGGEARALADFESAARAFTLRTGKPVALSALAIRSHDGRRRAALARGFARMAGPAGAIEALYFQDWAPAPGGPADAALVRRDGGLTEAGEALLRL